MNLDRFTQKDKSPFVAAQRLARSPEPCARFGASPCRADRAGRRIPARRCATSAWTCPPSGRLAAALNKTRPDSGGSLSADPRLRRVLERARTEAKRLRTSTSPRSICSCAIARVRRRSGVLTENGRQQPRHPRPHEHPRGRVTSQKPESTYQPWRSSAADSRPRRGPASSTRSSAATGESARHPGPLPKPS